MKKLMIIVMIASLFSFVFAEDTLDLTEEEKAFIEAHPVITLGIDPGFHPFEFVNSDGSYDGIAKDYLRLLSEKTNLQFEVVPDLTWTEAYEDAVEKRIDMLPCISLTADRENYFTFSDDYYSFQRVIFFNEGKKIKSLSDITSIAVQRNSSHVGYLMKYPELKIHYYDDASSALAAVVHGKEEAFLGNLAKSSYEINTSGYVHLTYIVLDREETNTLHMAVRNDWPELVSIINKGLASISEAEKLTIYSKWVGVKETVDYSNLIKSLAIIGLGILLMMVVSMFWILRLKKEIVRRKAIELDLKAAKRDAEHANEVKSNFLARMSHEIRTPLNAINGLSYILSNTELNRLQRTHIDKIQDASKTMLSIINDILDFSKIEAGKITLEHVSFSIEGAIRHVLDIVAYKIDEKQLDFTFTKDPSLPNYYLGDGKRLEQVLLNIINNAVKFTNEGSIALNLKLEKEDGLYYTINFEVQDTGIGMSKEHLSKLFEPFTQEDASISRKYGGTGLGLSISKHLIELMGGLIEVSSQINEGTCFQVVIPLEKDEAASKAYEDNAKRYGEVKTIILHKDIEQVSLITEYLRSFNINPEFTSSINQFDQLLTYSKQPYQLVLVDEKTVGTDVQRWLHELHQDWPSMKVILMMDKLIALEEHYVSLTTYPIFPSLLYNSIVDLFQNQLMQHHQRKHALEPIQGHVLVVEDNLTNQMIARTLLEEIGVTVEVADNGQIACNMVKTNAYDLVLMDLHMPVMNGYEATKEILAFNESLKIIAMTADAIDGVKEKCHAYGMFYFISKPFDPEKFLSLIRELLSGKAEKQEHELYDKNLGLERLGQNEALYNQVVKVFLEENSHIITALSNAYIEKDWAKLDALTHKIKSSVASIGSEPIRTLATELQTVLKTLDETKIELIAIAFIEKLDMLIDQLMVMNNSEAP